jgi:hypothetical protein
MLQHKKPEEISRQAISFVFVESLGVPGALVEIEAIAVVGR